MRCIATSLVIVMVLAIAHIAPCKDATPSSDKPEPAPVPQAGAKVEAKAQEPAPEKKSVARLGAPKSTANAPQFALKTSIGGGSSNSGDRAAEVKRFIDAYHNVALKYVDELVRAKTPEQIEAAGKHTPTARTVRPFASLLVRVVAADPKDTPAFDALMFLAKYSELPEVSATFEVPGENADSPKRTIDPIALLLEHHADKPKIVEVVKAMPAGDATNDFLLKLFDKTHNPEVRTTAGVRLIGNLLAKDRTVEAEKIAVVMSEDRYLEGVPMTNRPTGPTAREWGERKLREIRLLGIGKTLPEVSGEKLDGGKATISDYRGKVVVLDVWATWCGPCVAMIPHEAELAANLTDKPFALVSVSVDEDKETLTQFLSENPMPWDHWWVGQDSELSKTLNISAFPTIFVLDAKGVIRYKNVRDEKLDEVVNSLLNETK